MKTLIIVATLGLSMNFAESSVRGVNLPCKTTNGEKEFIVMDDQIVFQRKNMPDSFDRTRNLSSSRVRTRFRVNGFDKFKTEGGQQYKVHIEDVNNLNPIDDYITITSPSNHKITYPIECKLK